MNEKRKSPAFDPALKAKLEQVDDMDTYSALAKVLAQYALSPRYIKPDLRQTLYACWDKPPQTLEEFYAPAVHSAIVQLWDETVASRIKQLLCLQWQRIYSASPLRRSYHSSLMADRLQSLESALRIGVIWPLYDITPAQATKNDTAQMAGYTLHMALALHEGEADAIYAAREAMLGDNSVYWLTSQLIQAIIISENKELLELLGKLLLAAKGQEGLRQQILENIDAGSHETVLYFLRLIAAHDFCRFSSVIRALDTWTGLGYGNAKPALAEKCVRLAIQTLTAPNLIPEMLKSDDVLEIYFSLWSAAARNLEDALPMVEALLESGVRYKQLVALYFAYQTDSHRFSRQVALRHLDLEDAECLAWLLAMLGQSINAWNNLVDKNTMESLEELSAAQCDALFHQLEALTNRVGGQKTSFSESVFPWASLTLDVTPAYGWMLGIAAHSKSRDFIDRLAARRALLNPDQRDFLFGTLLSPALPAHRTLLQEALGDRSQTVRRTVRRALEKHGFDKSDVDKLCETLSTRQSSQRKEIVELLAGLSEALLDTALSRLLHDDNELRLQAGLSLLLPLREKQPALAEKHLAALPQPDGLSGQTLVLLEQLANGGDSAAPMEADGFGLYCPQAPCFAAQRPEQEAMKLPGGDTASALKELTDVCDDEIFALFKRILQVFSDHADYEYETRRWDGSHAKVLLGNTDWNFALPAKYADLPEPHPLEHYPFHAEFLQAARRFATDGVLLANLFGGQANSSAFQPWFIERLSPFPLESDLNQRLYEAFGSQCSAVYALLRLFVARTHSAAVFDHCMKVYAGLMDLVGEADWCKNINPDHPNLIHLRRLMAYNCSLLTFWRKQIYETITDDADFSRAFLRLRYESLCVGENLCLTLEDYLRAYQLKLIPQDVILQQLTTGPDAALFLNLLTRKKGRITKFFAACPALTEWTNAAIHQIVSLEAKRGELPAPLSVCVSGIERFEGAAYFAALLTALGKNNFYRGYDWGYTWSRNGRASKTESLSRLLRHCFPAASDTAETLASALQHSTLKPPRLAEAALYAPQWAALIEEVTGWTGLKSGIWFFHAHISEHFSAEKETEVALYSPITPQQFNDGAFDKDWFLSAYQTLGEKRFQTLYRSAKYITRGAAQHRRSQLYADAVLGRLDADALRQEIIAKRNQEKLRCYPLISLQGEDDALARYEFIRRFEHESRQFGAQRRESERKACRTALENLAVTMGCADVDRMLWRLEGRKMDSVRALMAPQNLGTVTLALAIDASGEPSLTIEKGGKQQKSLPAALKKHETAVALQHTVKELREQRRRAQQSLESAMTTGSIFLRDELEGLLQNPLLAPMVSALLWTDGACIGLPALEAGALLLQDAAGVSTPVSGDSFRLIHPHDLVINGVWSAWQRKMFGEKIVQPFKQIFREYYPLTNEERAEGNLSRRYAGNQVQPKKAVALLRGRGWTVDYGEGLQKVCYASGFVVRIYAMADWFSPADIEPPTLEILRFYRRADGSIMDLADVPPIAFSEAMRDLDLMVSVAHAGGVDPEASHSTVELRIAIAEELIRLLGVENVSFLGSHAKIHGSLGNYSVHMGSGVSHTEGVGSLVILPVHSQTRGRIFLPFADDDPKTAEILSKILLLAEDKKIKDPSILSQIAGH